MNSCFLVRCPVLITATLAAISAGTARADSLTLIAQFCGQYDYGIQLDPNHGLVILAGDQITLTGLFGVTSASVLDGPSFAYSTVITTPMSVTIVDTTSFVLDPPRQSNHFGSARDFVRIDVRIGRLRVANRK
jgi:hypothetical protein